MNSLQKKDLIWFLGIVVIGTALCIGLLFFFGRGATRARIFSLMRPDVVTTSTTSLGNIFLEDKTDGYTVAIPSDWHLEQSSGAGIAVYAAPDSRGTYPCKIEISELRNPSRQELVTWLESYLRADPTAEVREFSRNQVTIARSSAIAWPGILNGISSTLAYVATGTAVYEFAPSVVVASGSGAAIGTACVDALGRMLATFQWLP